MARPCKEGMDYFPHDTDAVNDEKIEMLRSLYGNNGYAFYFIMLERIYRSKNFELDVSDAETREEMFQILSRKMMLNKEEFEKILNTAFKYKCFDRALYESKGVITSEGIKKRAAGVVEKRASMKKKYEDKKVSDGISDAETMEEINQETITESGQSKVKESKENNNISMSAERTPYEEIKNLFNSICITLPKIKSISANRQKTVKSRWMENPDIKFFENLFCQVNASSFLRGDEKWKNCGFDWIMTPSNMQKILEGNYDNKKAINDEWRL